MAKIVLDIAVRKNWGSHIDASHSRQPLVKGERLVRHEVNAVMPGQVSGTSFADTDFLADIAFAAWPWKTAALAHQERGWSQDF